MMIIHDCVQCSDEWLRLRAGMPTASNFKKVATSTGTISKQLPAYANLLAGERFAGKPLDGFEGNKWTDRGGELEPDARDVYSFLSGNHVEQVGFVTDDDGMDGIGCSPDGLVGGDGLVEFKCLKAENHIAAAAYIKKHNKPPSDYVAQTQGQMYI